MEKEIEEILKEVDEKCPGIKTEDKIMIVSMIQDAYMDGYRDGIRKAVDEIRGYR